MILTLTPNPSVDRTVFLDHLVLGSVNRSTRSWSEPSGKGVNVALALLAHGQPVRAVVPIGGSVGAQLRQMLNLAELDIIPVPVAGEIRSNISLTQPDGTVTKINEAGPRLSAAEADDLTHRRGGTISIGPPGWCAQAACPTTSPPVGTASRRTGPSPPRARRRRQLRTRAGRKPLRAARSGETQPARTCRTHRHGAAHPRRGHRRRPAAARAAEPTPSWPVSVATARCSSTPTEPCGATRGRQGRQHRRRRRRHARRVPQLLCWSHRGTRHCTAMGSLRGPTRRNTVLIPIHPISRPPSQIHQSGLSACTTMTRPSARPPPRPTNRVARMTDEQTSPLMSPGQERTVNPTMQAVVIHGREDYRLEQVPVPVPAPVKRSSRSRPSASAPATSSATTEHPCTGATAQCPPTSTC